MTTTASTDAATTIVQNDSYAAQGRRDHYRAE